MFLSLTWITRAHLYVKAWKTCRSGCHLHKNDMTCHGFLWHLLGVSYKVGIEWGPTRSLEGHHKAGLVSLNIHFRYIQTDYGHGDRTWSMRELYLYGLLNQSHRVRRNIFRYYATALLWGFTCLQFFSFVEDLFLKFWYFIALLNILLLSRGFKFRFSRNEQAYNLWIESHKIRASPAWVQQENQNVFAA